MCKGEREIKYNFYYNINVIPAKKKHERLTSDLFAFNPNEITVNCVPSEKKKKNEGILCFLNQLKMFFVDSIRLMCK